MQLTTCEAILLDVFDLHERDRIVAFLTREHGKKRGVAQGARRKYSRFAGQLQPLAKVRVTWFEKEGRELVRISDVALLRPAQRLQTDLEGILLGSYLADHMLEFAQENEANDPLFRLLDSTLESLVAGVDRSLAARYYEAWMLRLAGIFPTPRECPLCERSLQPAEGAVLSSDGEVLVCRRCAGGGGRAVSPGALVLLHRIARQSLPQVAQEAPPAEVLAEVEALCERVRRSFLGHELKSREVIRRTLAH